jgi:L-ascorbate metabolism protein UlaG (beta-lactamase superfamily)
MGILVKWLGHASFEIQGGGKVIYIDPYKGEYVEKADIVLVTHSHYDHCDLPKIELIREAGTVIIAPQDVASKIGREVRIPKSGEEITIDQVSVKVVDAYNNKRFRSPGVPCHAKGFGFGYLVKVENKTIYHAGDTDFIPEMEQLGHVDLALLPAGGGYYTMDAPEAADAALAIKPEIALPMHVWEKGVYYDPAPFKEKVEARSKIKVVMLKEGDTYSL